MGGGSEIKTVMRSLARRGGFRAPARTIALGLAIAFFATLCALPVVWMLGVSFVDPDGGLTVRNYSCLFTESRQRRLMLNSALLGAGASLLATLIANAPSSEVAALALMQACVILAPLILLGLLANV